MLAEALIALAGAGGSALVGAMATDAWQATRAGVARLFGHGGSDRQTAIEAQLDGNAALVAQASDPDEVRQSLAAVWRLELAALLRQYPETEDELRALVEQIQQVLPPGQQTWVQTNIARDRSTQYNVQHGDIHVHPGHQGGAGAGSP
jgi:hypothetical protein